MNKLVRYDPWTGWDTDEYENTDVEWTQELQDAWDKAQEVSLEKDGTCSKCWSYCLTSEGLPYYYCPMCGQKIKW